MESANNSYNCARTILPLRTLNRHAQSPSDQIPECHSVTTLPHFPLFIPYCHRFRPPCNLGRPLRCSTRYRRPYHHLHLPPSRTASHTAFEPRPSHQMLLVSQLECASSTSLQVTSSKEGRAGSQNLAARRTFYVCRRLRSRRHLLLQVQKRASSSRLRPQRQTRQRSSLEASCG